MGLTRCLGCNKSLGGFLDGFGTSIMAGQVCLTCKKKIQAIPNYAYMAPDVLKDFISGKIDVQTATSVTDATRSSGTCATQPSYAPAQTMSADDIAEELKKYQKLLDDGIITSDEYSAMRKRFLGL